MTTENNMKFVELAVSKDQTRYNLCSVYRDKKHMVATDGHRLHFSSGLPEIENGYFLSGIEGDYPQWEQVLPKEAPLATFSFFTCPVLLDYLNGVKALDKSNKHQRVSLMLSMDNQLRLFYCCHGLSAGLSQDVANRTGELVDTGYNYKYLLDVVAHCLKVNRKGDEITVKYYGADKIAIFETPYGTAAIMPMRKPA